MPPTPGINLDNLKNEDVSSEDGVEEGKAADPLVSFGHELIDGVEDGTKSSKEIGGDEQILEENTEKDNNAKKNNSGD